MSAPRETAEAMLDYAVRYVAGMPTRTNDDIREQYGAHRLVERLREYLDAGEFDATPPWMDCEEPPR